MSTLAFWLAQLTEPDETLAEAAVNALAEIGPAAFPHLAEMASHPDPERRWWAVRALAAMPGTENLPHLLNALEDGDSGVRLCAALALRENPTLEALPRLIALLSDADRLLARLAGDALVAIGQPATDVLLEAVVTAPPSARLEACRALAAIGDLRSVTMLFKLLDDDSALLEYWANEGLNRMGIGMTFFKPG